MDKLIAAAAGYSFAQIPPYHDRTKGKASVLVLSCIDPRYTNDLAFYLTRNQYLHADYDLICLAGAEVGVFHSECWKSTFTQHIDLALQLHGIEEIWVFSHMDCGMYKATLGIKEDNDEGTHIQKMTQLKKLLSELYPGLRFKGHIISLMGFISEVDV